MGIFEILLWDFYACAALAVVVLGLLVWAVVKVVKKLKRGDK
jgi:hypothetical protein